MSDFDSHNRTAARCGSIRRIAQRPSEVNDEPAYKSKAPRGLCTQCKRLIERKCLEFGVCVECRSKGEE